MRIILYTGKGGVGKTSIASATALTLASQGKKVMIMSTDMAHSLGDSLEIKLGYDPMKVTDNLDAMEIDVVHESEKSLGHLKDYMKQMLTLKGDGGIEVEELLVFPGLEELFAMFRILDFYEEGKYDVLIIDCAPTGETLSLLKYPDMLSDFIEKVLPVKRKGVKVAGPVIEKLMKVPMPKDNVFDDVEYIMDKMGRLQHLMLNKECVSLRIVTTPESIVIEESKRNFTYLQLFDYNVDAVIVNRIYPKEAMEGYFSKWMTMQEEGLGAIRSSFVNVPIYYLELQDKELRTVPVLLEAGKQLFDQVDSSAVLYLKNAFEVIEDDEGVALRIYLPLIDKKYMDLAQEENAILLTVNNQRRRFELPEIFHDHPITQAKFTEGYLILQ